VTIARAKDGPHSASARFALDLEAVRDHVTRFHVSAVCISAARRC
jgi:hypothetical protein